MALVVALLSTAACGGADTGDPACVTPRHRQCSVDADCGIAFVCDCPVEGVALQHKDAYESCEQSTVTGCKYDIFCGNDGLCDVECTSGSDYEYPYVE